MWSKCLFHPANKLDEITYVTFGSYFDQGTVCRLDEQAGCFASYALSKSVLFFLRRKKCAPYLISRFIVVHFVKALRVKISTNLGNRAIGPLLFFMNMYEPFWSKASTPHLTRTK